MATTPHAHGTRRAPHTNAPDEGLEHLDVGQQRLLCRVCREQLQCAAGVARRCVLRAPVARPQQPRNGALCWDCGLGVPAATAPPLERTPLPAACRHNTHTHTHSTHPAHTASHARWWPAAPSALLRGCRPLRGGRPQTAPQTGCPHSVRSRARQSRGSSRPPRGLCQPRRARQRPAGVCAHGAHSGC
jgi:hypothetical protein